MPYPNLNDLGKQQVSLHSQYDDFIYYHTLYIVNI